MRWATSLLCALSLSVIAYGYPEREGSLTGRSDTGSSDFRSTCKQIAAAISSVSEVYFPRMFNGLTSRDPPN
jgi:hypothetical protein